MGHQTHVLHIIPALARGGAELVLFRLIQATEGKEIHHSVICLSDGGELAPEVESLGGTVLVLGLDRGLPNPFKLVYLRKTIKRLKPNVIQTWMYHSDLIGGLVATGLGVPVVWNLRQTEWSASSHSRRTLLVMKACARLSSRVPHQVISGSEAAFHVHAKHGYDITRMTIIPNGFDTNRFTPDPSASQRIRKKLKIPLEVPLVGHAGRLHPHKDHSNLLLAFSILRQTHPSAHLVLMGRGVDKSHPFWASISEGLLENVHLVGEQAEPELWLSAMDLFVSPSATEGFPNAVGEAMACGIPCVVTDVGDSARLVGGTGRVVPPKDPVALASAVREMLGLTKNDRHHLGIQARLRVSQLFSMSETAAKYLELYQEVSRCAA